MDIIGVRLSGVLVYVHRNEQVYTCRPLDRNLGRFSPELGFLTRAPSPRGHPVARQRLHFKWFGWLRDPAGHHLNRRSSSTRPGADHRASMGQPAHLGQLGLFGDAKVEDLAEHAVFAGGHEDVVRLDVSMDDACLVGLAERSGDLDQDLGGQGDGQAPLFFDQLHQALPLEQLHDDVGRPIVHHFRLDDHEALHLACAFDLKVAEPRRTEATRLLARVNEQLWMGHFDLWEQENIVMFRQSLLLAGNAEATQQQIEVMLQNALETCERYYQAFQFVVWAGHSAQRALDEVLFETAGEA